MKGNNYGMYATVEYETV